MGGLHKVDVTRKDNQASTSTTIILIEESWNQGYGNLNGIDFLLL